MERKITGSLWTGFVRRITVKVRVLHNRAIREMMMAQMAMDSKGNS